MPNQIIWNKPCFVVELFFYTMPSSFPVCGCFVFLINAFYGFVQINFKIANHKCCEQKFKDLKSFDPYSMGERSPS